MSSQDFSLNTAVNADTRKLDLEIWHPLFDKVDRDTQWQIVFLFLDEALGEFGVESFVGHIEIHAFDSTDAHRLSDLQQLVDEARQVHRWETISPLDRHMAYKRGEQTNELRGDVIVGITRLQDETLEFEANGGQLPEDPLQGKGASLEFVRIDIESFTTGTPSAERQLLEEEIQELFAHSNGGASPRPTSAFAWSGEMSFPLFPQVPVDRTHARRFTPRFSSVWWE